MTKYWLNTNTFHDGAGRFHDLCYFNLVQDDLQEEDVAHTILAAYDQGNWFQLTHINWRSVAIEFVSTPAETAICIGEHGDVLTYFGGEESHEHLGTTPKLLRNAKTIDGECYVCGMDREVYRRAGQNHWLAMHADTPDSGETLGFEAIDGFSSNDLYAVGWQGEIWQYVHGEWTHCDSPTNLILTSVCCTTSGDVYVCGQEGLLMKGRGQTWEVLIDDDIDQDFWDLAEYQGRTFVASKTFLYEIVNDRMQAVELAEDNFSTCGRFSHNDGVLWSIGDHDVFTFDGLVWKRIE